MVIKGELNSDIEEFLEKQMAKIQIKRPKNRNQILKEINYENNKLKQTIKELRKEISNMKKENYKLKEEKQFIKRQSNRLRNYISKL
jgi:gas vesicle protein